MRRASSATRASAGQPAKRLTSPPLRTARIAASPFSASAGGLDHHVGPAGRRVPAAGRGLATSASFAGVDHLVGAQLARLGERGPALRPRRSPAPRAGGREPAASDRSSPAPITATVWPAATLLCSMPRKCAGERLLPWPPSGRRLPDRSARGSSPRSARGIRANSGVGAVPEQEVVAEARPRGRPGTRNRRRTGPSWPRRRARPGARLRRPAQPPRRFPRSRGRTARGLEHARVVAAAEHLDVGAAEVSAARVRSRTSPGSSGSSSTTLDAHVLAAVEHGGAHPARQTVSAD